MNPRILVVQPEVDDPAHLFGDWLEEAGCTLEVVHPYAGDPVPTLDGYAGLLVMGGAMGANDDEVLDWIGPVKELIRDAVSEGVPTLGICLGHQLMGAALGGRVTPNPRGQQVGLIPVGWTDAAAGDRLFGGLATPRRGVQWNYDLLVEPPAEAVVLAQTPEGEVQVARFGPNAWGVQLHPEVDETIVGTWVTDSERGELADRGLDADALLGEIKEAREELDHAWAPLAAGFADVALGVSEMSHPTTDQGASRADGVPGPRVGRDGLRELGEAVAEPLVALIARTADPDLALNRLVGLVDAQDDPEPMLEALVDDEGTAMRLLSVLGASEALADHLSPPPRALARAHRPDDGLDPPRGVRRPGGPAARGRCRRRPTTHPTATGPDDEAVDALRVEYRRLLLRLASRDLTHHLGVDDAAAELSDLAAGTLDAALAIARQRVGEDAQRRGWRWSRWASAAATSSTTSPTST